MLIKSDGIGTIPNECVMDAEDERERHLGK
jgi:hypothetical protein